MNYCGATGCGLLICIRGENQIAWTVIARPIIMNTPTEVESKNCPRIFGRLSLKNNRNAEGAQPSAVLHGKS